ncbi:Vitamin B12 transporter BtuB [Flavobacterium bizetiae]|uniref:Vitamin B12 transporter BtuB n=1 Tax=Flavobacterium bizetiae TaxID=2704140 RepID=A0A6J4GDA8_9FLAO|nr:TonB-dependent receptor [Flavobacterium bizetiae]CAA9197220.1 Vitamin B12 transporter BtuB [Flavobacterium bizetiae]CAD5342615.1 Vitamin B12 transporter BtuB [Flavobacterium bizetiae]CAD5348150.1 Vitamin B12 transporter BtuB [Flavobacterium bizetiae]
MKYNVINTCYTRVLKITLFLILCFNAQNITAQNAILDKEVTLSFKNETIANALTKIEEQTGCIFSYTPTVFKTDRIINKSFNKKPLSEVINEIFSENKVYYRVRNNTINLQSQAEKGKVSGKLTTSEGNAAPFVSVILQGTNYGATSDENGFFSFAAPEGDYIILTNSFGLEKQKKTITILANNTTKINFTLSETSESLKEVVVNGNKINRFAERKSDYVSKLPLKNLENPQVYNVVNSSLMKEQLNVDITRALVNIPGAVSSITPAGGTSITIRGFSADVGARNGLQYYAGGRSSVDPVNVERIEVLKGPSATLFGNTVSSYGGAVNLVTKKPFETSSSEISYSVGSWSLNRITADINTPLNSEKTVLFRINAALNKEESFLNTGHKNTFAIAPSITYQASDKLFLSLDMEVTREDLIRPTSLDFDVLNLKNVNQIPLNYKQTLFADDFNAVTNTFRTYFEAKYQISKEWSSYTNVSVNNENVEKSYQAESVFISADSIKRGMRVFGPFKTINTNIKHNLKGDFKIGSIRNRFIWGLDYTEESQDRYTARGVGDTISIKEQILLYTRPQADKAIGTAYGYNYRINRYATYVSDLVNVTDRLMVLLSMRLDRYVRKTSEGGDDSYSQTAVTPKFGLIYQPIKDQVSLFANYMSGFTNLGPVTQPDGSTFVLKPEYGTQWETGIKINTLDNKYSATLSYYNIDIRDAVRMDGNQYTFQDGKQKSKGFDVSLVANPFTGFNLLAGYAFNQNKYKQSESGIESNVTSNPENVANFWLSYKFQPGKKIENFGVGFGGNFVDQSYFNIENTVIIPSYTLLNGTVFYDQNKWRFGIACNNMTNQKYWSVANPQALRQFILSTSFRF